MKSRKNIFSKVTRFWKHIGPGLVTGASDDDPSGIATYSQAGAGYGLSTLWTSIVAFPLMAGIQQMCARIGLVTRNGLTTTLRKYYPKWILWIMIIFSFPAIIMNIGADIAGMGAAAHLLTPAIPSYVFSILFTCILMVVIIYYPYRKVAAILKWACITLLMYLVVPFFTEVNWKDVARSTFIPHLEWSEDYISMLVAILGTTISPYLFFWQATMEAEETKMKGSPIMVDKRMINTMREDVISGMFFSNLVMFFVILTCGSVLHAHGVQKIDTVEQAASALRPIAGNAAYGLFSLGIVGTGFLAIPVLSGSLSYMMAETFGWEEGLDRKFNEARPFYGVIVVSLVVGLVINYIGITPIQGLIYTAILYGITAPILIPIILHISNNRKIMGDKVNKLRTNILGWIAFALMAAAAVVLLWQLL